MFQYPFPITTGTAVRSTRTLNLWFRRGSPTFKPGIDTEKSRYLCAKQMPNCMSLTHLEDRTIYPNLQELASMGFVIHARDRNSGQITCLTVAEDYSDDYSSHISSMTRSSRQSDRPVKFQSLKLIEGIEKFNPKRYSFKIDYDDVWQVLAIDAFRASQNMAPLDLRFWPKTTDRICDEIPISIMREFPRQCPKNPTRFEDIESLEIQLYVVFKRTYWGRLLLELLNAPRASDRRFAERLKAMIIAFLSGGGYPNISTDHLQVYYKPVSRRDRSLRLIEVLKTVQGMFLQRFAYLPEEEWNWNKFDLFVLGSIAYLLPDEFLDGTPTKEGLGLTLRYSRLKAVRKEIRASLMKSDKAPDEGKLKTESPLRYFETLLKFLNSNELRRTYQVSVISQTRGCGLPPPLMVSQSKDKFLKTVTTPPRKVPLGELKRLVEGFIKSLPDDTFSGLTTKSAITVSSAASIEKTRSQGGTIEAISEILSEEPQHLALIYDLETGARTNQVILRSSDNLGTFTFWKCFHHVINSPVLTEAQLSTVYEPAKIRIVTKANAALKIVLDVVNKICSFPLTKVRSSSSGMQKDAHGWNLFQDLYTEEMKHIIFPISKREKDNSVSHDILVTEEYEPCYALSYDFVTATDYLQFDIAQTISVPWMVRCGLPKILIGLVCKTCYRPRKIFYERFIATGDPVADRSSTLLSVTSERGVLMGDPLTKVVLHLINATNRTKFRTKYSYLEDR